MSLTTQQQARSYALVLFVLIILSIVATSLAEESANPLQPFNWEKGPCYGDMGEFAEVEVPEGYIFTGAKGTRILMEQMGNPTTGTEVGLVAREDSDWFLVFEFDKIGYVKDDEKESLDADAILKSIKNGTKESNKEREKNGWPTMTIVGWKKMPEYNTETNNLEWAIEGKSENESIINYSIRLLGRKGVMSVTIVADPANLDQIMPQANKIVDNYKFKSGHTYAEYRDGDKIAKYGLSALVVGGAAAVAINSGLIKWLWKICVVVAVGIAGFFKKIFAGKSDKSKFTDL